MALSTLPSPALAEVEALLRCLLTDLAPTLDPPQTRGRPRIFPSLALWGSLLVGVVRGFDSQRDLWRLLAFERLWDYPRFAISDQAVYHRLDREGSAPMATLLTELGQLLAERLTPHLPSELAPFASQVVAIDETTLDPVARRLPALRDAPAAARLPGTLAGCFDLRRQQWQTVCFRTDTHQNEKVLARTLVADLPAGSLILADLGYFGFAWFDELTAAGQWWVSRLRAKTSYERVHTFFDDGDTLDALVWLGKHRADRARYLVRLVQYRQGGTLRQYVTNVTDPQQLGLAAVVGLYGRRWDIELAVQLVKQHLGLHLLWSAKATVVVQQLWAVLCIAQILQALRLEVAAAAGVDVFAVSLPLLVRYWPYYVGRGLDPWAAFVEHGVALGFIRPSRRLVYVVPDPDRATYRWPPPDLVCDREPRYAQRKCGPR